MADIVVRSAWGARPRQRAVAPAPVSRRGLVVHHAVTPQWTGNVAAQRIQNIHLGMGWADVGYTFMVDVNGRIYQGRALNIVGGHTSGQNTARHAVCIIGNFTSTRIPQRAIDAVARLHVHGAERSWWTSNLSAITRHRDHSNTECPGNVGASQIDAIRAAAAAAANPPRPEEPDMSVPRWARDAWRKLTDRGVIDGTRPNDAVTRAELAVILDRLSADELAEMWERYASSGSQASPSVLRTLAEAHRNR